MGIRRRHVNPEKAACPEEQTLSQPLGAKDQLHVPGSFRAPFRKKTPGKPGASFKRRAIYGTVVDQAEVSDDSNPSLKIGAEVQAETVRLIV